MRKVLLIATLVAFGLAGTAYAATVVTQVYIVKATVTPKKSGTKAKPKAAGVTVSYTVKPTPSSDRPNVVKTLVIKAFGVQAHQNEFPTCSTSTLNSKGPSACPKKSHVGSGFFVTQVGSASSPSVNVITCRVDLSIYNGGGKSLSYYVFANPANKNECPSTSVKPLAFAVGVKEVGTTLVETINVPFSLRHLNNNTSVDDAVLSATVSVPAHTITIKAHKVKGKKVAAKKFNFTETIACPVNHKRHFSITFTTENGKSQTATANAACS